MLASSPNAMRSPGVQPFCLEFATAPIHRFMAGDEVAAKEERNESGMSHAFQIEDGVDGLLQKVYLSVQ